jgi:hypothetical protein
VSSDRYERGLKKLKEVDGEAGETVSKKSELHHSMVSVLLLFRMPLLKIQQDKCVVKY